MKQILYGNYNIANKLLSGLTRMAFVHDSTFSMDQYGASNQAGMFEMLDVPVIGQTFNGWAFPEFGGSYKDNGGLSGTYSARTTIVDLAAGPPPSGLTGWCPGLGSESRYTGVQLPADGGNNMNFASLELRLAVQVRAQNVPNGVYGGSPKTVVRNFRNGNWWVNQPCTFRPYFLAHPNGTTNLQVITSGNWNAGVGTTALTGISTRTSSGQFVSYWTDPATKTTPIDIALTPGATLTDLPGFCLRHPSAYTPANASESLQISCIDCRLTTPPSKGVHFADFGCAGRTIKDYTVGRSGTPVISNADLTMMLDSLKIDLIYIKSTINDIDVAGATLGGTGAGSLYKLFADFMDLAKVSNTGIKRQFIVETQYDAPFARTGSPATATPYTQASADLIKLAGKRNDVLVIDMYNLAPPAEIWNTAVEGGPSTSTIWTADGEHPAGTVAGGAYAGAGGWIMIAMICGALREAAQLSRDTITTSGLFYR